MEHGASSEIRTMSRSLRNYLESSPYVEQIEISLLFRGERQLREELGDLSGLCKSIQQFGLLQPLVVRAKNSRFEVVCGNRRFEACRRLMKRYVYCIVKDIPDQLAFEISLVENIQRNTLNPVEEARAFRKYVFDFGWGGVSDLARKIGKSQEYVSHRMILLDLPNQILERLSKNEISSSQAQELAWFKESPLRNFVIDRLESENLTVTEIRRIKKELESNQELTSSERCRPDSSPTLPDFTAESPEKLNSKVARDKKVMEDAILCLRVAMVRLDSVISKVTTKEMRDYLIRERFALHEQIDRLITKNRAQARIGI